ISADGVLPGGTVLQPSRWYTLELDWDLARHRATLLLDGQTLTQLQQRTQARPGPSYLRLRSTATALDTAGFFVSSVSQIGLPTGAVRESAHLSSSDASAALSGVDSHWTSFRFDDYVPNTNATASGNGGTGTFAGSFTGFIRPQTAAPPVGILVESSAGAVSFTDATSMQVTSDLLGPKNGGSLTISFVDPSDPTKKAAVSGFAFRYGSTIADNVDVTVFDLDGHEMPDYSVRMLDETLLGASAGMIGFEDLARAPTIHRIVFTASGSDTWLLGSFALDPSLADFAFTDFTIVPEPLVHTMLVVLSGVGAVRRRKL
ncbi:MAG TPA: hypothetical protein VNL70_01700, partial [Tepidisphaeraceae bacterium]|nr:hypothetical protein [Tepidisphaeraceae bacterium]